MSKRVVTFGPEDRAEVEERLGVEVCMVGMVLATYVPRADPARSEAVEELVGEVSALEEKLRGRDHAVAFIALTVRAEER